MRLGHGHEAVWEYPPPQPFETGARTNAQRTTSPLRSIDKSFYEVVHSNFRSILNRRTLWSGPYYEERTVAPGQADAPHFAKRGRGGMVGVGAC